MAIDVISPRISFSHDLNQAEFIPIQQHRSDPSLPYREESTSDFDFCLTFTSVLQDLSTADELFSGGRILPFQLNNKTPKSPNPPRLGLAPPSPPPSPSPAPAPAGDSNPVPIPIITNSKEKKKKKRLKEFLSAEESDDEKPRLTRTSSFWQFGRSASLNCENSRGRSLIRPLKFLSRSYSTGSAPAPCPKQAAVARNKDQQVNNNDSNNNNNNKRQQLRKQIGSTAPTSSTSCPRSHVHGHPHHRPQKPPLNKNYRSYGADGAGAGRVSLVLNLPPQYISKATVGLVGSLGSLLCNGKQKKK